MNDTANYEARLADVIRTARDVVKRRILTLGLVAAGVTVLGVAATLSLTPVYEGLVRLQIDPSRNPLARSASDAQAQLASEAIETEVSVINSLDLARTVVKRLNLTQDPEFSQGFIKAEKKDAPLSESEKLDQVTRQVMGNLSVSREKLTYIIGIRYRDRDAAKSAAIANAFATAYLDTRVDTNIGTAARQFQFFEQRLQELANEARAADDKVAAFQAEHSIVKSGNNAQTTILDQQVGPLATQLSVAQAQAEAARAQAAMAKAQVRAGRIDAVADVLDSQTIIDLRRQRAEVTRDLSQIENRYGPRYPDAIRVKDQLAQIDVQIRDEASRIIRSLEAKAVAGDAQVRGLRQEMAGLESQQAQDVRARVTADSLQRDADSKHSAYDKAASLAMESRQASQNSIAQARIIDAAETPAAPAFPNKPLLFLVSLLVGLGAGVAVITAQELMVAGVRSVEDIEGTLGIPLIGAIPALKKTERPADNLLEKPTSQFAEALRNIRASIVGVKAGVARPKLIALTSAMPSEGKTTTALALARTMALNGSKTILLDVDVRRAQLRQIASNVSDIAGTVELLQGSITLDEAIQPSGLDGLDQILVRAPYFSSENLFGNQTMNDLLSALSERYEAVILDLPPLLGLADGRFIAALSDAVVLIVKWDDTPQHVVESAVNALKSDGSNLVGAVLSMVDPGARSVGSYYYDEKYSHYYTPGKN
ncbi:capsular exopolysaccharide synthesis family protein [Novosphingobium sp. SG754]|nr:GNVR domain-containing protein [Novosphingobium sp. BK626]MBB3479664.1 capsular exopolysaccharide synthesis family protein [Novosphingobium sp. BK369]NOX07257.1 capsular exopolysaccharide synthesis family protein [Novosphingobium sp. SG754]